MTESETELHEMPAPENGGADDARPAPASIDDGVWLQPHERALLVSKTRSGKSTVELVLASYFACRIVLIDVKRRYRLAVDGVDAYGVDELRAALASEARVIRFVPTAIDTPDDNKAEAREWSEAFQLLGAEHDLVMLVDELVPKPAPSTGAPGTFIRILSQKAVDRVGAIMCTGRWRGMARECVSHADHVLFWPGGLSGDELRDFAKEVRGEDESIGQTENMLRSLLASAREAGEYAFVWWDRNRDVFRIVPAFPEHLRARAIALEMTP